MNTFCTQNYIRIEAKRRYRGSTNKAEPQSIEKMCLTEDSKEVQTSKKDIHLIKNVTSTM